MKILLAKDQRRLLQLKSTELISSDDERPRFQEYKKKMKKDFIINTYIDNLRIKNLH